MLRYAKIFTRAQLGLVTNLITIEVHISAGLPGLSMVGLAETAIKESRDRVRSAILNSGFEFPRRRVTINLAPADLPKREGGRFDLPIALGILIATQQINWPQLAQYEFTGELGLDGSLHRVSGAAITALAAQQSGRILVAPAENLQEIQLVHQLHYQIASSLMELCQQVSAVEEQPASAAEASFATSQSPAASTPSPPHSPYIHLTATQELIATPMQYPIDLNEIHGQSEAKRVLEIAAAGGHSLFIMGPPGVGKSMLAHRLITILPPLTYAEALENSMLYSLYHDRGLGGIMNGTTQRSAETKFAKHSNENKNSHGDQISGDTEAACQLDHPQPHTLSPLTLRPFRAPHHSISTTALIGGSNPPMPGEISLANHGVLFLDELLEFPRKTLEALREPLENHQITISRAANCAIFPCHFQLVVAMNPCPCGHYGDKYHACSCTSKQIKNYHDRLSGPLLDRLDLWLWMPSLGPDLAKLHNTNASPAPAAESSTTVLARVVQAQQRALTRAQKLNYALSNKEIEQTVQLTGPAQAYLQQILAQGTVTARSYYRILKVARTIADLADSGLVELSHLQEAFSYRKKPFHKPLDI